MIMILWRGKKLIALTCLVSVLFTGAFILWKSPVYESTSTISLGQFNDVLYAKPEAVVEIIGSETNQERVMNELGLTEKEKERVELKVSFVKGTNLVKIDVKYPDPLVPQTMADKLAENFLDESKKVYQAEKASRESLVKNLESAVVHHYSAVNGSTVDATDSKDGGNNPITLKILYDQEKLELLKLQEASLIEKGSIPLPVGPAAYLLVAIAGLGGLGAGMILSIIVHYFTKNPIRFSEPTAKEVQ
jgi:uncharacterized protein involved in exopolysaccharide biosynthesis